MAASDSTVKAVRSSATGIVWRRTVVATGFRSFNRRSCNFRAVHDFGNGRYATKSQRAASLRQAGLDHVQISIQDSRATESDRIAGIPCFEQKLTAARLVKELGFPLTLNFVLHRHNLDRIEEMLELAEALAADRVELANTQYYGWALQNRAALLPTREQLQQAEQAVKAAQKRHKIPMGILYVIPDYYAEYPKPCMGGWGQRTIVVTPQGEALPCQVASVIPDLEFANVRDRSLEWIWYESTAFNRFRGTDWLPEPCQSCDRVEIDWGGCRCQAFLLTQNAAATDPVCHLSPHPRAGCRRTRCYFCRTTTVYLSFTRPRVII